jgi:hypothetical protein
MLATGPRKSPNMNGVNGRCGLSGPAEGWHEGSQAAENKSLEEDDGTVALPVFVVALGRFAGGFASDFPAELVGGTF